MEFNSSNYGWSIGGIKIDRVNLSRRKKTCAIGTKPRLRWEDNIKMDLREVGWGGMDRVNLALDTDRWRAVVNTVMNLWVL
jgi:hypothetical protein